MVHTTGVIVFVVTYILISIRHLNWLGFDRPAGALLGAVACVALGTLTPGDALGAIDGSTIVLLFGVMGMGAFLGLDGFFEWVEEWALRVARTPQQFLAYVIWGSGILSAFITNDAVCVFAAPVLVRLIQRHRLPPLPFVLGLATAANTGSVATLVGNPQNMLCATLGHLDFRTHLIWMTPVAVVGLGINHGLVWWLFRDGLRRAMWSKERASGTETQKEDAAKYAASHVHAVMTLAVIGMTAIAYMLGTHLAWTATGGFVVLMMVHRRDTRQLWGRIDWALLLFFAALFVVVEGFIRSGAPAWLFAHVPLPHALGGANDWRAWFSLAGVFLIGSNIVSNVPFILVVREHMASMPNATIAWEMLAMASTFAGNLTLLGSVANIIVAEQARDVGGIGFFQYLRVGLPVAIVTTGVGVLWLMLVGSV